MQLFEVRFQFLKVDFSIIYVKIQMPIEKVSWMTKFTVL